MPELEQESLYNAFHLDEPWDSPHNKSLIQYMPSVYQNPDRPRDGKTNYLMPVGLGTVFNGDNGTTMSGVADGPENTILLVEADEDRAVIWTKPDDLDVDFEYPMEGLGRFSFRRIYGSVL